MANVEDSKEGKVEDNPIQDVAGKDDHVEVATKAVAAEPLDYAKDMWTTYQQDYLKELNEICYNDDYPALYNTVQVKQEPDDLLHADPVWTGGKFIRKKLSHYQKEHIEELKAKMLDATRRLAAISEERKNTTQPASVSQADYGSINEERKRLDKTYYEESLPIMFKLQLETDSTPRPIVNEDRYRLEWESIKFAVDAVHLSFGKALIKKAKTSQNLYT